MKRLGGKWEKKIGRQRGRIRKEAEKAKNLCILEGGREAIADREERRDGGGWGAENMLRKKRELEERKMRRAKVSVDEHGNRPTDKQRQSMKQDEGEMEKEREEECEGSRTDTQRERKGKARE